jgi:hypothetical protein
MKRDMDLAREILLAVEALGPNDTLDQVGLPHRNSTEVGYHIGLLHEAGLLNAIDARTLGNSHAWLAQSLTWGGHEFLDSIRSDTVWQKVKGQAASKGVDLTFDTIKALAVAIVKGALGL